MTTSLIPLGTANKINNLTKGERHEENDKSRDDECEWWS